MLTLHGAGLLHKHATAPDENACVACQMVGHQAVLDLPDGAANLRLLLLALLFLLVPWHRSALPVASLYTRPRSRAPPH
jgi:hypothetical protein